MPRQKSNIHSKKVTITTKKTVFEHQCTLRNAALFNFFQDKEEPKRPPIANIIRKTMYEHNWGETDYEYMETHYSITRKRINDALSVKFEPIVIDYLCEYLKISKPPKNSIRDVLANYDFEKKREKLINKSGCKSAEAKAQFIKEFNDSWSDETYERLINEINNMKPIPLICSDDDIEEKIKNQEKKELFHKLLRIYEQYPELLKSFCDSFIEEPNE